MSMMARTSSTHFVAAPCMHPRKLSEVVHMLDLKWTVGMIMQQHILSLCQTVYNTFLNIAGHLGFSYTHLSMGPCPLTGQTSRDWSSKLQQETTMSPRTHHQPPVWSEQCLQCPQRRGQILGTFAHIGGSMMDIHKLVLKRQNTWPVSHLSDLIFSSHWLQLPRRMLRLATAPTTSG
jgi:hypothetical protein